MGKVISFANQKGGVGKSTLALMFANYLQRGNENTGEDARDRESILLIDTDKNQVTCFDQRKLEEEDIEAAIELGEIPTPPFDIVSVVTSEIPSTIKLVKDEYDFIIVDYPGNDEVEGFYESISETTDVLVIPTSVRSKDLSMYFKFLKRVSEAGYNGPKLGVPSKVTPASKEFKEYLEENKDKMGIPMTNEFVPFREATFARGNVTYMLTHDTKSQPVKLELLKEILEFVEK